MLPVSGGSLLVAWQLRGKTVLVIGGGDVASGRIEAVLSADAQVTVIAPRAGLHQDTQRLLEKFPERITYYDRFFQDVSDLHGADMVLTAIDDVDTSRIICAKCRELKIPVNVADIPPSCDFYFGSQIRRGPLQIMISTNGNGPKVANMVKRRLEKGLPENVGEAVLNVGRLRTRLRERAPGVGGELGKRRMQWMSSVCTRLDIDGLANLDDSSMELLLEEGWEKGRVPTLSTTSDKEKSVIKFLSTQPILVTGSFLMGAAFATVLFLTRRH